ncbi:ATP-dependent acyl-CoA ligase [Rhodococcus sp. WS4]|nr:ATP-dependent acyl-CoA ligase [Rhodococcus sp. WS4]
MTTRLNDAGNSDLRPSYFDRPIPQILQQWNRIEPDRPFLQEVDGPSQTYGETLAESLRWALGLRALGVAPGDRVVVLMPPKLETVNVWVGLGWLRAIDIPLNTEYKGEMLRYVLDNSRSMVAICAERHLEAVVPLLPLVPRLKTVVVWRETSADLPTGVDGITFHDSVDVIGATDIDSADIGDGPALHDTATVLYTSGTTGPSKGVVSPWGSFVNAGRRAGPPGGFQDDDIFYSTLPMYHAGGLNWIHGIAAAGGQWVFRERMSTTSFWDDVRRYSCTTTFLLGAMANFLGRAEERPDDADNPIRAIVAVPYPDSLNAFEKRFDLSVHTVYGMTEVGIVMKSDVPRPDEPNTGRPFAEYEMRVVDEFDVEVPHGTAGELVIRSREPWTMFSGYFEMEEATQTAWRNLWFHTGDAMRRDEAGNFYFVDRIKDSIRRRGENISSAEVESYLFRHDAVFECAAIPVPSEWGEDDVKVCVVLKSGRTLREEELILFLLGEGMPRFMIPRFVEFLADLPRTPTGKIQKHVLRAASRETPGWDRDATMQEFIRRRDGGS